MNLTEQHFKIGQATDHEAMTGCTVVISEKGATGGISVRGGSPNTRDTDALKSENNRKFVHGVVLSGGSAFGLAAGDGVVNYLEDHQIGRDVAVTVVPNVCGTSLFDLKIGRSDIRPDPAMGYAACEDAFSTSEFQMGNYGAGTGATVGIVTGEEHAMKGGIGYHCIQHGKLTVSAVVAVNAVGDVYDEVQQKVIAGVRRPGCEHLGFAEEAFLARYDDPNDLFSGGNTVIGCVMTNATFPKAKVNKLADLAHNGIARAIRPAHTTYDGDTMFFLCANEIEATFESVSILAVEAVRQAIIKGVQSAESYQQIVASQDFFQQSIVGKSNQF